MRYVLLLLIGLALVVGGCASKSGPGAQACDPCEASIMDPTKMPPGSAASAAVAGQRAANAPWVEDKGVSRFKTTLGRGAGDTVSSSADTERRSVASGGAQNIALMNPAQAQTQSGGGTALAIRAEYGKTLDGLRADLQAIRHDPELSPEQRSTEAAAIRADIRAAQSDMALALSHVGQTVHNYDQSGDNTMVGYSKSGTGTGEESKAALEVLEGGVKALAKPPAPSSGTGFSAPPIPERSPPPPPVPAETDPNGGG